MSFQIYQLAITGGIGLAVGLIGRIIFDWLKVSRNGKNGKGALLEQVKEDTQWIRAIHDNKDADGLPLWYIPREWKKTLDIVSERTLETNIHLKDIKESLGKGNELLKELITRIEVSNN